MGMDELGMGGGMGGMGGGTVVVVEEEMKLEEMKIGEEEVVIQRCYFWINLSCRESSFAATCSRSFNIPPLYLNGFLSFQSSSLSSYSKFHSFPNCRHLLLSLLAHHVKPRLCHSSNFDTCKTLQNVKQTHAYVIVSYGTVEHESCYQFSLKLINLYTKFNDLDGPFAILKSVKQQTGFSWNLVMKGYVDLGLVESAFCVYRKMREVGVTHDCYTFPVINKAVLLSPEKFWFGKIIHSSAIRMGLACEVHFCNTMIEVYMKGGSLGDACKLFGQMPYRDIVSWTAMISVYVKVGNAVLAFQLFSEMRTAIEPNAVTMLVILQACSSTIQVIQFHGYLLKKALLVDRSVVNSLLNAYAHMTRIDDADVLFGEMDRDIVSWNIMLSLYSMTGEETKMAECYRRMHGEVEPSSETLNVLVSGTASCGNLFQGGLLQCLAVKKGLCDDKLRTSLMHFYAKCGEVAMSTSLFEEVCHRNPLIFNAMMSALLENGMYKDVIVLFKQLLCENFRPTPENLVSLVAAYTNIGAICLGRSVHGYFVRNSFCESVDKHNILQTAILNLYVRCGSIYAAKICFDKMVVKDAVAWTSMIEGYGNHGLGLEALQLFRRMVEEGVKPNSITFLSLLSACSHSGLCSESYEILYLMKWKFNIEPDLNHYTCIVDMLGRSGRLKVALSVILKLVACPDSRIWGALLAASRVHADKRLGEYAAKRLLEMEPDNAGYYTILSNIEASGERWSEVEEVRSKMKAKDLQKQPGWSCIEVKGLLHGFVSGDGSHPYSADIYKTLQDLSRIVFDIMH